MPLALTWSELDCWETDIDEWSRRYLLGFANEPSFQMKRGTFIHNMLFTKDRTGEKEAYTVGEIRIHDKILNEGSKLITEAYYSDIGTAGHWDHEEKREAHYGDIPIKGYLDGNRYGEVLEVKTGSQLWTQERADNHGQIFFYDILKNLTDGIVDANYLLTCSTTNGKCKMLIVYPDKKKCEDILRRIEIAYLWMMKEDFWDKRVGSKDRIAI